MNPRECIIQLTEPGHKIVDVNIFDVDRVVRGTPTQVLFNDKPPIYVEEGFDEIVSLMEFAQTMYVQNAMSMIQQKIEALI